MSSAFVCWFTGLPCSGKTTLARMLTEELRSNSRPVELLDGDELRKLAANRGFSQAERDVHLRQWAVTASLLERNGVTTVCAFVSPYRSCREFARSLSVNFVEIYLATPIETCEERDVKGMYREARAGRLLGFTGVQDPYEVPENPELTIDTTNRKRQDCLQLILKTLQQRALINGSADPA